MERKSPRQAMECHCQGQGRSSLCSRTLQSWSTERTLGDQAELQDATRRKARSPGLERRWEAEGREPTLGALRDSLADTLIRSRHFLLSCSLAFPLLLGLTSPRVTLCSPRSTEAEPAVWPKLDLTAQMGVGGGNDAAAFQG